MSRSAQSTKSTSAENEELSRLVFLLFLFLFFIFSFLRVFVKRKVVFCIYAEIVSYCFFLSFGDNNYIYIYICSW